MSTYVPPSASLDPPPRTRDTTVYTERRRAVIHLSESDLVAFLGLPDGLRVVAVSTDFRMLALSLLVEGDDLEPVTESAEPPESAAGRRW